ncbi:MAG: hypothetical protein AAF741_06915 [Bacteroidota bacterium]
MGAANQQVGQEQSVYSFHAFVFPFSWRYENDENLIFEDQTDLSGIISRLQKDKKWTRRASWADINTLVQYNEVAYFYEFVRPVLYDTGKDSTLQCHYYYNFSEDPVYYKIELWDQSVYSLEVDDIVISFYDNGVGVMAFHLINREKSQSKPNDILKINFYGRRVYPPFLNTNLKEAGNQAFFDDNNWERGLDETINLSKELAKSLRIESSSKMIAHDDFLSWTQNRSLDRPPKLIKDIFPNTLEGALNIKPVLDDRMYVISWFGHKKILKEVKGVFPAEKTSQTQYQRNAWWYKYVFVDGQSKSVDNNLFQMETIDTSTYTRWTQSGTFYGMSRYSLVVLTGEMNIPFPTIFLTHTQTIYYKLALLCLVQRAGLLRFSEEITAISQLDRKRKNIGIRIGSLYKEYLRFINKVYFREVTAQEQGIEMYKMIQDRMSLPSQVLGLQQEMEELHQYAMIVEEERRNDKLDILSYIGAFFVVPSFIGTYYGIGGFEVAEYWYWMAGFSVASALLAYGAIRARGINRVLWLLLLIVLMIAVIFVFPQIFGSEIINIYNEQ